MDDKNKSIDLLTELFQQTCIKLWNLSDVESEPSALAPRLVYPLRGKEIRISEQEARLVCCSILDHSSLFYSVETPTNKTYQQKGNKFIRGRTDLTIYKSGTQPFQRDIYIEFKNPGSSEKQVGKDIEQLVREGYTGGYFQIVCKTNSGTFKKLFQKYTYGFIEYQKLFSPEEFSSKKISILFCFCVLQKQKQKAYMRPFLYQPSKDQYEEYVTGFFDSSSSSLKDNWQIFEAYKLNKENIPLGKGGKGKGPGGIIDGILKDFSMLWEDSPGFLSIPRKVGCRAEYKKQPCLWVYPKRFEIAPKGKGNRQFDALCKIQRRHFSEIRGKARVYFNSSVFFREEKFKAFVIEVKKYVSTV